MEVLVREVVRLTEMIEMEVSIKRLVSGICIISVMLGAFVGGVSAVLDPEGYMGTVIEKDIENNTFEVQTEYEWQDGWQSNTTTLKWIFPNEDAMNEINVGDCVEILGFSGSSGWTIGLGKMKSSTEGVITDIYGDPYFLEPYSFSFPENPDPPLLGNYTIEYNSTPNCSNCEACNCEANYTNITIINESGQIEVGDYQLYPGQNYTWEGAKYHIDITFHSGEAPADPECVEQCIGPQPISNFTLHISAENQPPTASFAHTPDNPTINQIVTFNASNSTDSDGDIVSYVWDFGDGNTTNTAEKIITHSYALEGDYNVNLTVTDNKGANHSVSKVITITTLRGDVNHDGNVTSADAVIALQIAVGRREYDSAADVNGDNKVTSLDALMILQAAVENIRL